MTMFSSFGLAPPVARACPACSTPPEFRDFVTSRSALECCESREESALDQQVEGFSGILAKIFFFDFSTRGDVAGTREGECEMPCAVGIEGFPAMWEAWEVWMSGVRA
jgi:hypothetical protein